MFTQEQYLVLQQSVRRLEVKIELLNMSDVVIDSFEGYSISGSISLDSDSDYRRTGNISMVVEDLSLIPSPESKIWFNRKVKVYIGLKNWSDEIIWFSQGIFVMQNASIDNSKEGVTINISLSDLMSLIDGKMNGNITHEIKVVPEGNLVSDEIRQALSLLGKVSVDDIEINGVSAKVPYAIMISPDSTVYEYVKTLLNLYYGMEIFYNEDGFLIVRKVRDRKFDPVVWDFTAEGMNLVINDSRELDFTNVRNSIFLWGRKKDTGETIKWSYKNRYSRNSNAEMEAIVGMKKGDVCHVINEDASYYWSDFSWIKLEFTVSPEFNIESIGEKAFAFTDETVATIEQAMLRAEFELKKRNNMAESISFTCVPLYGMNTNEKIYIKNNETGIEGDYLVKSISLGMTHSDTMSVQAEKLYY